MRLVILHERIISRGCRFIALSLLCGISLALTEDPLAQARDLQIKGRIKQAENKYLEVISSLSLRAHHPAALFALGEIYWEQRQWGKAITSWKRIASDHKSDPLAPEALWRVATTQSGPAGNIREAIKTMQALKDAYPRDPYGEKAAYGKALLHSWSKNKGAAHNAASLYLSDYPQGKFVQAANKLLADSK